MSEKHAILGGKVYVYQRSGSPVWQCSAYLEGKNRRISTKESSLKQAKQFAEDWYFGLRDKSRTGSLEEYKTFKDAACKFVQEYVVMTDGERNPQYVKSHEGRINNHLLPFFGERPVKDVNSGSMQEYRMSRMTPDENGKKPSRSQLHHEEVTLRQIMKTALRHGWIEYLPDFSAPYKASGKVAHRAWFSNEEYKQLYTATREHAKVMENTRNAYPAAQLHDKVLFMANTGLRPDEANVLQYRDVEVIEDEGTGESILLIQVRGKRGVGYCKSTKGAVFPFKRLTERNNPAPSDLVFPQNHTKQFNRILEKLDLKFDREGNRRSMYSLRHSYISFRLMEGADIYQIAKNCRTSVEMIEKHYAVHLKNAIDAGAINRRR